MLLSAVYTVSVRTFVIYHLLVFDMLGMFSAKSLDLKPKNLTSKIPDVYKINSFITKHLRFFQRLVSQIQNGSYFSHCIHFQVDWVRHLDRFVRVHVTNVKEINRVHSTNRTINCRLWAIR